MNQSANESQIIANDEEQNTLLEPQSFPKISKSFYINNHEYKYEGPDHPQIAELIEMLDEKQRAPLSNQTLESIRQKILGYEKKFDKDCTFFYDSIKISFYSIISLIVYFSIYLAYLVSVISLKSDGVISQNSTKLDIVEQLPQYGLMVTTFTLAISLVKDYLILLLLFGLGCILPSFYLFYVYLDLLNVSKEAYDYDMILFLSVFIISILNGIIVSTLQQIVEQMYNQFFGALFSSGWCLFMVYLLGFLIFSYIIGLEIITLEKIINYIINSLYIPIFVLIGFSYTLINTRLFDWPAGILLTALDRIKQKIMKKQIEQEEQQSQNTINCLSRMSKIVIYLIGGAYLTMEIVFYVLLASELKKTTVDSFVIITLSVELIIIPLFLFLGVFISVSDRKPQYTYLIVPLIIGAPLIFGFQKFGNYLDGTEDITNFSELLYVGPLFVNVLWLSLTLLGLDKRRLFISSLGFVCFFVAIPIGVFLPLYNLYSVSALQVIAYVFILIGVTALIGVFVYLFIKSLRALRRAKELADQIYPTFDEFQYYNLKEPAFCINSVFFLLSYFIISYFFWYIFDEDNTASTTEAGTMFTILVIIPLIFILFNIALGHRSLEITSEFEQDVMELKYKEQQLNEKRMQKRFYQNFAVCCGIVIPIVVFLPIAFLVSDEKIKIWLQGLSVSVPVSFALYKFLVTIKNESIAFEDFFQPFVTSLLWCCVIFPFAVIVPSIAVFVNNSSATFQYFAQGAVGSGLFVCVIGVTGTSLFFSLLLNREEFERKKREILKKVMERLTENHVMNDISVVGMLYMKYLNKMQTLFSQLMKIKDKNQRRATNIQEMKKIKQQLKENLIIGDPINVIKYDGPDLQFDHKLVSKNIFEEQLRLQKLLQDQQKQTVNEQQLTGFKKYLMDCICCRCGLEEMNQLENQKNEEIVKLRDLLKLDEDIGNKLDDLIPQFSNVYKIVDQADNFLQRIDFKAEDKQILNKPKYQAIQDIISDKTLQLKSIQKKSLTDKALGNIKTSEQYHSLKNTDSMVADFMHEVFMEFANNDEGLEPTICYNDLQQFCRLTDLHFDFSDYQKYAGTLWKNQSYSLNEVQFAGLLKGMIKEYDGDLFDNLRQLVIDHIYPQLIMSMKSLMVNLKFANKKLLQNVQVNSPFARENFCSGNVPTELTKFDVIKGKQNQKEQMEGIQKKNNESKIVKKSKRQMELEYELAKQQLDVTYEQKIPWHKKCCYSCNDWFRTNVIEVYFPNLAAAQPKPKVMKNPLLESKRQHMPMWKTVAEIVIDTLFEEADKYEKNYLNFQQKGVEFKPTSSNILALVFRIMDIYSLAAVAYNSQVGWFGSTSFSGASTISGEAFYDSYAFFFFASFGISILYGFLGSLSLKKVKNNTFGQDENGNIAKFPQMAFLLPRAISILSGFFMTVMRSFMDAFICDYTTSPYKFARDTSIECLTSQHYLYMGLGLLGVGIYYPLSTYLQPTFQYSDHSLDLKFKSTYIILYIQGKLLIMCLSSFFNTMSGSFLYQMIFSIGVLIIVLGFHIRMEPCLVKWYNLVEQMLLMIVIFIYTGAVIIMITGNNVIGIIFTSIAIILGFVSITIYLKRASIINFTSKQIVPMEDIGNELPPIPEENRLNIYDLIAESQLKQDQKGQKKVKERRQDTENEFPNFDRSYGDINQEKVPQEMIKVKDEINMEPILVNKSNISKLRL